MRAQRRSREEQYQLILECRKSGMSDYIWCQEHGIKVGTFYNWVKRLRKDGTYDIPAPAGRDTYAPSPKQDIVKVELVDEDPVVQIRRTNTDIDEDPAWQATFDASLEITISGANLRVSNHINPELLGQVIFLLKEP